jgi:hypothetical protein
MICPMLKRRHLLLTTALILLLLAGFDLLVVDLASAVCKETAVPGSSTSFPDEDCFCCCAHIVFATPASALPLRNIAGVDPVKAPSTLPPQLAPIYHPPRA